MRGAAGWIGARQRQNLRHRFQRQRGFARPARLVPQQAVNAFLREALLPAPHRRAAGTDLPGHFDNGKMLARVKNDSGPLDMFLRTIAVADDGGQSLAILGVDDDTDGLCHAPRFAWITAALNPLFGSEH
jgi:hypothetical protein